jgi:DNA repair exonuclease SbcCD ATPase subunit
MSDDVEVVEQRPSNAVIAGIAGAAIFAIGALIWCFGLSNHVTANESKMAAQQQQITDLAQKNEVLAARLRATAETLGQSVGMTQKQIDSKTQTILAAQAAQAAAVKAQSLQTAKLEQEQQDTTKQVASVATDVTAVKTDVTGAKSSIAETQQDLASTKQQLQRTIGDAGVMSGLIARNHDELETLKHKGDRSYFEFTLQKGAKPTLLSTVKLQLKKVDDKRSKYTLDVSSDDRNIEKKDKSLDEPVQFYSGKDPALFELVVNVISKNQVSGYLSTPKAAAGAQEASK